MPQRLRPRGYEREYVIYFLKNGGEILHETRVTADGRAEAKQWAINYAEDAHILYDKLSVRQAWNNNRISTIKYLVEYKGVDPLDAKRTPIQVYITRRQKDKLQKIYAATGLSIRHFNKLFRDEIERLYDMYYDENGKLRRETAHKSAHSDE